MDGIISQVERFAIKYIFSKFTIDTFDTAMLQMNERAENPTGNTYVLICNDRLYSLIQTTLRTYLRDWQTAGTFMFSQAANGEIEVGATYKSYNIMGNTIVFQVDRSLTREFGSKGYGIVLDMTADKATGQPAVQMFTLKNGEFISSKMKGVKYHKCVA